MTTTNKAQQSLRLSAELWFHQRGWWAPLIALLLVLAVLVHGLVLPRKARQADVLAAQVHDDKLAAQRQAQGMVAKQEQAEALRKAAPAEAAARFDTLLADASERSRLIRAMWQQAAPLQVRLGKIDFREERDVAGGFLRLRINVPTVGSYPAVKRLAFGLMHAYPALALDAIEFKRDRLQAELEGTLHFTLLMRL